ncbi:hypothetical protein [Flavobacterium branchiophilum]|nr:hypothetical protein [Flavobacterium branchiophilum]
MNVIEAICEWEALYNPDFNYTEFGTIKNAAGSNTKYIYKIVQRCVVIF